MSVLRRLANLGWAENVFVPLAVILMEALWVYLWLAWIGSWPNLAEIRPPLGLGPVIVLLVAAYLFTRLFLSRKWPLAVVRLSIVVSGLAVIFAVVRLEYGDGLGWWDGAWFARAAQYLLVSFSHPHPMLFALAAGAYLWWRGISLGRSPWYFDTIYRSFLIGLAALVAVTIAWAVSPRANLLPATGLYMVGFFFCGLTALAIANLRSVREEEKRKGGAAPVIGRRWLAIIIGVIGIMILVGLGAASLFSTDFTALLGRLFSLASGLLLKLLGYLLVPLSYLAAGLYYVIEFIISLFRRGASPEPFATGNFTRPDEMPETLSRSLPPEAVLAIKWSLFALVAAVMLFFIFRAISRSRASRTEDEVEETDESLWSWEGFKADVRQFFSQLWQRLSRRRPAPAGAAIPVPYPPAEDEGRLGIRDIYRRLLWLSAQYGRGRQHYETPDEYAARLGQAVPEGRTPLRELTGLYVDVRYGDREAGPGQLDEANGLWKTLRGRLGGAGQEK